MSHISPRLPLSTAILLVVLATVLTYQATASRGLFAEKTAGASVDLSKVLASLNSRADAEKQLESMRQEIEDTLKNRVDAIKAREEEIIAKGAAAPLEEQIEVMVARNQLDAYRQTKLEQLDLEKSLMLRNLYKEILEAIDSLALAQGYDMIMVDDTGIELSLNPESRLTREAQIRQQIIQRRMLYRGETVDITDELVVRMNNAFKATP